MTHVSKQGRSALVKVAEWLEAGAPHVSLANGMDLDRFAMDSVVEVNDECGTSCCIAGAVCQFEGLGLDNRQYDGELGWSGESGGFELAATHLDMSDDDAHRMFEPWGYFGGTDESFNSAPRGAAVIRHFLATGEVDWNRFDNEGNDQEVS
ncbi:hypothetical protein [Pseudomonas sp. P8_250]|uniref:hypothetical protein n=1 Tax=Pseudomonas sp. P8_250 TaxID=3043446 RepID=UPI002A36B5DE|nr:hypothetical protein [Pseudomonas sp. P8_250]MDX9668748.1 hypothetical protein [Pseudomonas sp. P8_250]